MKAYVIEVAVLGLFLGALMPPTAASAQIRFIPQVGLYAPTSDLGQVTDEGVAGAIDFGKKESTLAYGVGIELSPRPSSLTVRANALYASGSEVPIDAVGCTTCSARSTLLALSAVLVFRPLPELLVIQPYLMAGGGAKRYDFELDGSVPLDDQTNFTGHVGAGVELHLGGLRVVGEISDYVDSFEAFHGNDSLVQNDLFFTVGVVLGGR